MNTIIEMNHVTKAYRRKIKSRKGIFKSSKFETKEAIKDISFQIKEGEMVGIVGLNGAGKSTLIKSMLGILSPDSGEAKMFGRDSFQFRKKNAEYIGANFGQKSSLVWDLPFIYSLELNKKIYRISDERYEEILEELEQFLQIGELLNDRHLPCRDPGSRQCADSDRSGELLSDSLHAGSGQQRDFAIYSRCLCHIGCH